MDSLIRLRQLNQTDLSGYISQVIFPALKTSGISVGGNILPTGSGIYNLGSSSLAYNQIYSNGITLPSGSGIDFGGNFFTAYTSGGDAVVKVNNYTIIASSQGLSIIGPQGDPGPMGDIGPTGASGIGITGAYSQDVSNLFLQLSNGQTLGPIALPSGATGATGVSMTGFRQFENNLYPLYSNNTEGTAFAIASGPKGDRGLVGGVLYASSVLTGIFSGEKAPTGCFFGLPGNNPDLHFIRGMRYVIDQSGMDTLTIESNGQFDDYGIPRGTLTTNLFKDEGGTTGYLRFSIWDTSIESSAPYLFRTGRIIYSEDHTIGYDGSIGNYSKDSEVMENPVEDGIIGSVSFNVAFNTVSKYKYGFTRYDIVGKTPIDGIENPYFGAYVLGDLYVDYYGPQGPQGIPGQDGIPGPAGNDGIGGGGGGSSNPGVSVTGVIKPTDDTIAFLLDDGTRTNSIAIPTTGPVGPQGIQGPPGPSVKGEMGERGPIGPKGTGDQYLCYFNKDEVETTGYIGPSYLGAISVKHSNNDWVLLTGGNRKFQIGDIVWFNHNTLVGKSYSPWQKVLLTDDSYYNARYFYANIISFNSTIGEVQMVVQDTPAPVGLDSSYFPWYSFNTISMNLGGLGSPGIQGPSGEIGPKGNIGNSVFNFDNGNISMGFGNDTTIPTGNNVDAYFIQINSNYTTVKFDLSNFSLGQVVQVTVKNNGSISDSNNNGYPNINWIVKDNGGTVLFPYNAPAPGPEPGYVSIYSFVRHPDNKIYCTYSSNYPS